LIYSYITRKRSRKLRATRPSKDIVQTHFKND
jgi:hypothetical protein